MLRISLTSQTLAGVWLVRLVADMAPMNEKENYMCLANGDSDDAFRPPRKKKPGQSKPSDMFGSTSTENKIAEATHPLILNEARIGL